MSLIPVSEMANEVDDPVSHIISDALAEHNNTVHVNYQTDLFALPSSIKSLRSCVEVLHLDNNYRLRELTSAIGELSKLRWLNVNYCALQNVNVAVSKLTKLERLHLSNNQLTFLPPELGQLHMLNELHIDNNKLRVLPISLLFLPQLRQVIIENNPLLCLNDDNVTTNAYNKDDKVEEAASRNDSTTVNRNNNNRYKDDVPQLPYVYCDNCRILTSQYNQAISFHNFLQYEMLPFVQFTCSQKCSEHLRDRLEKYDCAHRCCDVYHNKGNDEYETNYFNDHSDSNSRNDANRGFFNVNRPLPSTLSVKSYC